MDKLIVEIKGKEQIYLINQENSEWLKQKIINEVLDTFNVVNWRYEEHTPSY